MATPLNAVVRAFHGRVNSYYPLIVTTLKSIFNPVNDRNKTDVVRFWEW
jgi:hypothetical protein